jgi:hypothetical protein
MAWSYNVCDWTVMTKLGARFSNGHVSASTVCF